MTIPLRTKHQQLSIPSLQMPKTDDYKLIARLAKAPLRLRRRRGSNPSKTVINRQIAIYVTERELGLSTTVIGRLYGRDHSTIIHTLQKVENNPQLHRLAINIQRQFEQRHVV